MHKTERPNNIDDDPTNRERQTREH